MLYKRVIKLMDSAMGGSKASMSRELGVPQTTFNDYLNEKKQDKLWAYLPKLLEGYPRLSRQWLYFGEGPMFIGMGVPLDQKVPLQAVAMAVEQMAQEAGGTNALLLRYIAGLPLDDVDERKGELERRYAENLKELNALKTEFIDLQKELLCIHRGRRQDRRTHGSAPTLALGGDTAT